jgi:hydrogenase expression/formation protein HypD
MRALLSSPQNRVQAYLAAGHVCAVMGWREYEPISAKFSAPIVVTGFEPVDLLQGILSAVTQLEQGSARVENQYGRAVTREGNAPACERIHEVFEVCDRKWRGIGVIPNSGYALRPAYADFDAAVKFSVHDIAAEESPLCISGLVLQGLKKPHQCEAFGKQCRPENPIGAPMVSSEGACAAYYRYYKPQSVPGESTNH